MIESQKGKVPLLCSLYTYDLARLLIDMIETEKYDYYHATNEGREVKFLGMTFVVSITDSTDWIPRSSL